MMIWAGSFKVENIKKLNTLNVYYQKNDNTI
jgi:hypothetical protein